MPWLWYPTLLQEVLLQHWLALLLVLYLDLWAVVGLQWAV
jgi:hypothetical protein